MKKLISLMLAVLLVLGVVACASPTESKDPAPADNSAAPGGSTAAPEVSQPGNDAPADGIKRGGTLRLGVTTEVIHPLLSFTLTGAGIDYYSSWPVYESLFRPNAQGSVDPWLLESYTSDPEALTYTFHIRQGVTFSDGSPLNAQSVKWNLDHYMEVGAKVAALLSQLESVEIVDEYTVQLNLSSWSSIIPYVYVMYAGRIIEAGTTQELLTAPKHPYTMGLLQSVPKLEGDKNEALIPIKGAPPKLNELADYCSFYPRCPYAKDECKEKPFPPMRPAEEGVHRAACYFDVGGDEE
ncbi:ABC transporter substrate-binding protein [Christensenellaceae bacterium OttesenSCG-928-M15]|nr:ABC transporter substrate-binding protein [Christensenellaceae bacterium OttesenSCG-928-M15]